MKIRTGFVSNSSASSFCIYGWTEEIFKIHPELQDVDAEYYESKYDKLIEKLNSIKHKAKIFGQDSTPDNEFIVGVGNSGIEIDHYMLDNEYWQDYQSPEPSYDQIKELDRIAEVLGLPKPEMYRATFWA